MLLWLLIILAVAIAALLLIGWMRPAEFRYSRSASINASPEKIFPLIDDLQAFNSWNPFVLADPDIKGTYSGPVSGPGAVYAFEGARSGSGLFEIMAVEPPRKLEMDLKMLKPFRGDNKVAFTLVPKGVTTTDVTWAMSGRSTFVPRLLGLFMNMDAMVGGQFAKGLANLKVMAEK